MEKHGHNTLHLLLPEMGPTVSPVDLDWINDMLWIIQCGRCDVVQESRLTTFTFLECSHHRGRKPNLDFWRKRDPQPPNSTPALDMWVKTS